MQEDIDKNNFQIKTDKNLCFCEPPKQKFNFLLKLIIGYYMKNIFKFKRKKKHSTFDLFSFKRSMID